MNFSKQFRIKPGKRIQLSRWDPAKTGTFEKEAAKARLEKNKPQLFKHQYRLYAENSRSLLVVLQGMDASGKDGVIRHVMTGFNPQGCTVTPFKAPSAEERDHDFLWRIHKAAPARGDIGVFNRSHYEDVLIVRVNDLVPKAVWKDRYRQINEFERILAADGTRILKLFLHVSEKEQLERLEERVNDPERNWKFNEADLKERKNWSSYMKAYEDMLAHCSTDHAPWHIIPADKKWFRNLVASELLLETLADMKLKIPRGKPSA